MNLMRGKATENAGARNAAWPPEAGLGLLLLPVLHYLLFFLLYGLLPEPGAAGSECAEV
jgi:hypothetical protein